MRINNHCFVLFQGDTILARYILEFGMNKNWETKDGKTAQTVAARVNNFHFINFLKKFKKV